MLFPSDRFDTKNNYIVDSDYLISFIQHYLQKDDSSSRGLDHLVIDKLEEEDDKQYGIIRLEYGIAKNEFQGLLDNIRKDEFFQTIIPVLTYAKSSQLNKILDTIVEKASEQTEVPQKDKMFKSIYDRRLRSGEYSQTSPERSVT